MSIQEYDVMLAALVTPIRPSNGYSADLPFNCRPYPSSLVHIPVPSWCVRHRTVMLLRMGISYQLIPYDGKGVF